MSSVENVLKSRIIHKRQHIPHTFHINVLDILPHLIMPSGKNSVKTFDHVEIHNSLQTFPHDQRRKCEKSVRIPSGPHIAHM